MNITLYKTNSIPEQVDKVLENSMSFDGTFRGSSSVLYPVFTICPGTNRNPSDYNYCRIQLFNRYYFITDITVDFMNVWTISCKVDVLMTYADEIRDSYAIVSRNENKYNLYFPDEYFKVINKRRVQTKVFPNHFNQIPSYIIAFGGSD